MSESKQADDSDSTEKELTFTETSYGNKSVYTVSEPDNDGAWIQLIPGKGVNEIETEVKA